MNNFQKVSLIVWMFSGIGVKVAAQNIGLIVNGSIEYQKVVNMHAILRKMEVSENALADYKANYPQFSTANSILYFSNNETLFVPLMDGKEKVLVNSNTPFPFINQNNVVYTNTDTKVILSQRHVFEENFIVKDTIGKIVWKITDEYKDIAGYTCRRANGLILDSIYIVAFYTNEIRISCGPESFTGLPGAALQVALPHDNIMWKAIRVIDRPISQDTIYPPKGDNILDSKQFYDRIISSMKNMNRSIKKILIKDFLM